MRSPDRVSVSDDGVGMAADGASRRGQGLSIMQYRASLIGATLKIETSPQQGTTVTCVMPGNHRE
jgi:signal transduction histidine kinase